MLEVTDGYPINDELRFTKEELVDIDEPCINLCQMMNKISGIETTDSCCGHGKAPYSIWFKADKTTTLTRLHHYINTNYGAPDGWRIEVSWTEMPTPGFHPMFLLTGPTGKIAYKEADIIAQRINDKEMR